MWKRASKPYAKAAACYSSHFAAFIVICGGKSKDGELAVFTDRRSLYNLDAPSVMKLYIERWVVYRSKRSHIAFSSSDFTYS